MAVAHEAHVWEEAHEEKAWREAHAEKALRDAYMEHAWRAALDEKAARDEAAAFYKATDGSRHAADGAAGSRPDLQCAQLAWSFMKLKRPSPPPISPATPPSSHETKHHASPGLPTSNWVNEMRAIDINRMPAIDINATNINAININAINSNATNAAGEAGKDRHATLDWSFGPDGHVSVDLKPTGTLLEDNEASGAPTRFASCLASPAIPATTGCDGKALDEALPKMELK
jgi:hypothetical protein